MTERDARAHRAGPARPLQTEAPTTFLEFNWPGSGGSLSPTFDQPVAQPLVMALRSVVLVPGAAVQALGLALAAAAGTWLL